MTLREQIAARLSKAVTDVEGFSGASEYEDACDLLRADECIRQMDWAARQSFDKCCNRGTDWLPDDITAAPDDWTPTPPPTPENPCK